MKRVRIQLDFVLDDIPDDVFIPTDPLLLIQAALKPIFVEKLLDRKGGPPHHHQQLYQQ